MERWTAGRVLCHAGSGRAVLKSLAYGELLPDRAESVFRVENAWPTPEGYRPVKSPLPLTGSLPGLAGVGAFIASDGTASLLAGSNAASYSGLYRYASSSWSSVMATSAGQWRLDQFGDNVVAVNGDAPVRYDLLSGIATALAGGPPLSSLVATVRQQVFLAGDPTAINTVSISGYNDCEQWTPGTNQSLVVPFPSGGRITGLAGGESAVILQERSVKRGTYTGDVTVWSFDEISRDIGCLAPGSVAQAGNLVFFVSDRGFMVCDRNSVTPIGSEKIDRSFFATYSRADIANKLTAAVDPATTTVIWAMPGKEGKLWCYNWTLEKWTTITTPTLGVFAGFDANVSLDALDGLYIGGLDSIPVSLDSPIFAGGNPLLMVATWNAELSVMTGPNMEARFGVQPIEIERNYRVRVTGVRPISDATEGTVTLDARARAGDPVANNASGAVRPNGRMAIRANGRHIGVSHVIPAGAAWTYCNGIDLDYEVAGVR